MDTTAPRPAARAVGVVGALAASAAVLGVLSFVLRGAPFDEMFRAWIPHNAPLGILGPVGMALVLRQRPGNRAARLLFASSLAASVHVVSVSTFYALLDRHPQLDAAVAAGAPLASEAVPASLAVPLSVFSGVWIVSASLALWGLPLVPDGRWPRGRWRWIGPSVGAGMLLAVAAWVWSVVPRAGHEIVVNEPAVSGPVHGLVLAVGMGALGASGLGSSAAIVARWRQADRAQRAELRPVALTILLFLVCMVVLYPWQQVWAVAVAVAMVLMNATLLLAMARGGLFDVEIFVSRAVTAALLAAFITVVYVGVVVGVGALVGDSDNLVLALAATALVAVAFEPLRRRTADWARRLVTGAHASPQEVLARLSDRLARADSTDEVLARVLDLLVAGTGAVGAQVRVPGAGGWTVLAGAGRTDVDGQDRTVEVVNEGEVLGQVRLVAERADHLGRADERLLAQVAGTLGPVLRNKALTGELTRTIAALSASRERLVLAEDDTRRAIERDIHDGVQQQLLALRLELGLAETLAGQRGDERVAAVLAKAARDTDGAIRSLRDLARGTYPPVLEQEGLVAALRARLRDVPLETELTADALGRLERGVETAVYFCCLEAIQNATKHARASRLELTLADEDGELAFEVADDGRGFDPSATVGGSGLTNMTDRVEALGGTLTVSSTRGAGTRVTGRVPVRTGQAPASAR